MPERSFFLSSRKKKLLPPSVHDRSKVRRGRACAQPRDAPLGCPRDCAPDCGESALRSNTFRPIVPSSEVAIWAPMADNWGCVRARFLMLKVKSLRSTKSAPPAHGVGPRSRLDKRMQCSRRSSSLRNCYFVRVKIPPNIMKHRISLLLCVTFCLVLPCQAVLFYDVDIFNDTITFNGSATGGPLSLGDYDIIVWTENVASSDNSGASAMVQQSGTLSLSGGVSALDVYLGLNSNGSIASIEFSIEPDSNSTFDLTFVDYTWSYAGASTAQKDAFENQIFGADLPITNTLGSFGDLVVIPEPASVITVFGLFVLCLMSTSRSRHRLNRLRAT